MALNNCCSPDLSNDRRQNDVAGNRKINDDGVGLTPSIGQFRFLPCFDPKFLGDLVELTGIEPVTSCLQSPSEGGRLRVESRAEVMTGEVPDDREGLGGWNPGR